MPQWLFWIRTLTTGVVLALPGAFAVGTNGEGHRRPAYTVSQTHSLHVQEDGLIDIVLSIVFNVPPGGNLPGSSKTILSDLGVQNIVGDVAATDASGHTLQVATNSDNGRVKVAFNFAQPMDGTLTPHHTVNLAYTVSGGVCAESSGRSRFGLPWAHLWAVPVVQSTYEISFADTLMDMGKVCIGATGFRLRCGLTLDGTKALQMVTGAPIGTFFEWSSASASARSCLQTDTASGPPLSPPASWTVAAAEEDQPVVATTLGLAAAGSSLLIGGVVAVLANKARRERQRRRAREREAEEPHKKQLSDLMELDDLDMEEGATNSTLASSSEIGTSRHGSPASPAGTSERLRQSSKNLFSPSAKKLNQNFSDISSPHHADTGAGLGAWEVSEEFLDEELAALSKTSVPEYSERTPSHSRIGKSVSFGDFRDSLSAGGSSRSSSRRSTREQAAEILTGSSRSSSRRSTREQAAEIDASPIRLHVAADSKASDPFAMDADCDDLLVEETNRAIDPFAVDDECDDLPIEDDLIRSSGIAKPKDLFASGALTTSLGLAVADTLRQYAPQASSWQVMEEYDSEDAVEHRARISQSSTLMCLEADIEHAFSGSDLPSSERNSGSSLRSSERKEILYL